MRPDRFLDRFARKHPKLGIPRLMLYIAIANVAVALLDSFSRGTFSLVLMFFRDAILSGQVWRLVTFVLVPDADRLLFVLISAYFYYWIGTLLEREWGTAKFTLFYLTGVILNILFGFVTGYASIHYVNLTLFFAFTTLYPDLQVLLFFIIPVKVKWLAWIDVALFALSIIWALIGHNIVGAILPLVAILNYFLFFWGDILDYVNRKRGRAVHQRSKAAINFKAARKKARETKGYMHKCAVCGLTDADDPSMEFRYCSKCDGYYCYCANHINSHVHIHQD